MSPRRALTSFKPLPLFLLAMVVQMQVVLAQNSTDIESDWGDDLFGDVGLTDNQPSEDITSDNAPRYTFEQEGSYKVNRESGVQTNRSALQLEWDEVFSGGWYAKVDFRYNVFWNQDIRLNEDESADSEFRSRNIYLQKNWGDTSLSVGKQIIVWGETETAIVADVFSPRNQQDFIFTSLEESRLSQLLFKFDHYSDSGHFSLLFNPDVKVDRNPFGAQLPAGLQLDETTPDLDPEWGFRWRKVIGRGDYSLFLADLHDNAATFKATAFNTDSTLVEEQYDSYQMLGLSANYTWGNLSVQTETAYNKSRAFQTQSPYSVANDGIFESDQLQASLSFNYTQGANRTWVLGLGHQIVLDESEHLPSEQESTTDLVFSVGESFLHETWDLSYTLQHQFAYGTSIHNISSIYKMTDNFSVQTDLFLLDGLGADTEYKNNSLLLRLSYSF